jgi:hypothetical protein
MLPVVAHLRAGALPKARAAARCARNVAVRAEKGLAGKAAPTHRRRGHLWDRRRYRSSGIAMSITGSLK